MLLRGGDRQLVARIGVAHHARAAVVHQHARQALGGRLAAVGHDHHAGVLRVAHAHAAAVVQADPARATGGVEQGVEQGPVAHRVRAVAHALGLAVGAGHRAGVQVVAADHDRRLEFARAHHLVERQPREVALAQAQPADAGRQPLEGDALARHVQPAVGVVVVREQLLDLGVGLVDVFRVTRERHPAERALALAEQRADVGRHEAGEVEGVAQALVEGHLADVVAVIHGGDAHGVEVEHGLHVHRAAFRGGVDQLRVLGRIALRGLPLRHAPARGQVAVDQVVGRGLVGHEVGPQAARLGAFHQFGQHLGRVAQQRDRDGFLARRVVADQRQRVVDVAGLLVHVARAQAEVDAALLALDVERAGTGQRGGQRLRAAHATQAGGEDPAAGQVVAVVLAAGLDEGLERALHDALAADVDPRARRHLPVHEQALAVQFVEVFPVGPFGHQVAVGEQHARHVDVRLEHAHRLARLHEQGLVLFEVFQRSQDLVEAGPVARGAADAAINHQVPRVLRHLGVQVVLDHPVGGFGHPVLAMQGVAARGADHAGGVQTGVDGGGHGAGSFRRVAAGDGVHILRIILNMYRQLYLPIIDAVKTTSAVHALVETL